MNLIVKIYICFSDVGIKRAFAVLSKINGTNKVYPFSLDRTIRHYDCCLRSSCQLCPYSLDCLSRQKVKAEKENTKGELQIEFSTDGRAVRPRDEMDTEHICISESA